MVIWEWKRTRLGASLVAVLALSLISCVTPTSSFISVLVYNLLRPSFLSSVVTAANVQWQEADGAKSFETSHRRPWRWRWVRKEDALIFWPRDTNLSTSGSGFFPPDTMEGASLSQQSWDPAFGLWIHPPSPFKGSALLPLLLLAALLSWISLEVCKYGPVFSQILPSSHTPLLLLLHFSASHSSMPLQKLALAKSSNRLQCGSRPACHPLSHFPHRLTLQPTVVVILDVLYIIMPQNSPHLSVLCIYLFCMTFLYVLKLLFKTFS